MKNQELSFLQKVGDNFTKFAKDLVNTPGNAAALAASPLLAAGAACGIMTIAAAITGDPDATAALYFGIKNPDSSMLLTAMKGDLPFEMANKTYQLFAGSLGVGLAAAGLAKVVQKFNSLSDEADYLKRENAMLKSNIANEHAVQSGIAQPSEPLSSKFSRGIANVSAKTEPRQEHEQATRINHGPTLR